MLTRRLRLIFGFDCTKGRVEVVFGHVSVVVVIIIVVFVIVGSGARENGLKRER